MTYVSSISVKFFFVNAVVLDDILECQVHQTALTSMVPFAS